MNSAAKLALYGGALTLVAAGAWGIGSTVGPTTSIARAGGEEPAHGTTGHGSEQRAGTANGETGNDSGHGDSGHGDTPGTDTTTGGDHVPAGLASSAGGYTLAPESTTLATGATAPFSFRIIGPDGEPVTRFEVEHEKRMHLIVVRQDTSGFQHIHPRMSADGTWSVPITLGRAGTFRVFADFAPTGGEATTLGINIAAGGEFRPVTYEPSRVATVDGYEVRLDGDLVPGKTSEVTLSVRKDGRDVTDLSPYLGAYGHLVALRTGDLAYLHVHPEGTPGDGTTKAGPDITFYAEVPTGGTYRLFLDFRHDGKVRTADFTVPAAGALLPAYESGQDDDRGDDGHGH